MDDTAALRAWRAGDRAAGRALFGRWFQRLRRFFRDKIDEGADDLAQATLLAALDKAEALRDDTSFRAWMFTIARNQLIDALRRSPRHAAALDPSVACACELSNSPSRAIAAHDDRRLLLEALRRVPLDAQVVLELSYWERLNSDELAQILGVSASAIRTRLQRARELVRAQLAALGSEARLGATDDDFDAWAARIHDVAHESP
ncbi:MAG: sigma-70 family RNA polymerase sigma factor [Nannocystaceae bacterium]|nr:sigma-70 family RNA polymerase sigma factor [Nannocystaceae bacterium]